ncbi:MAG TPA: hypothetical protein VFQ43_04515, partial [Nitrososphaera sp.]|nr:hypothetical protein [Nitrososphaera sp.]
YFGDRVQFAPMYVAHAWSIFILLTSLGLAARMLWQAFKAFLGGALMDISCSNALWMLGCNLLKCRSADRFKFDQIGIETLELHC